MTLKLILDTDPGVDDAMAIAYAIAHPDIELLALTTVFGNASVDLTTRNAQYLLERFGARDVAVARGAAKPLTREPLPAPCFVHGHDGLGNAYPGSTETAAAESAVPLDPDARHAHVAESDAADFIIAASHAHQGELCLAAVGPLTNIAEALRRDPTLPERVRSLVVMGGTLLEPGNVTPLAEANFFNDPHAADEVAGANWPLTVVGLDVTHQVMLCDADIARLRDGAGDTGQVIWDSSRFYIDFYSKAGAAAEEVAAGGERACAIHDASALVYLTLADAFGYVEGTARVITDGLGSGQMAVNRRPFLSYVLPHWNDRPMVAVCMDVDEARVREDFINTILDGHRT
ncbi:MAG: nucleoside hydrolase [Gammaproteobacteria bacterium]|nr:MAG: nucleoside hydrolase [Gammaproteobacteria bacterium]